MPLKHRGHNDRMTVPGPLPTTSNGGDVSTTGTEMTALFPTACLLAAPGRCRAHEGGDCT